ncbi:MAG: hypothetical protein HS111_21890 [Kofleriaceae bacterium]|nr:hypothetical protein [Kofleriaceae bacterium]MCL4224344.1 hypothetical protein [Myxococcales bacterium]
MSGDRKPTGKGKLADELGKALGLLDDKGDLVLSWFTSPVAEAKKLHLDLRRAHVLEALASALGPEDRRGRAPADEASPWWFHVARTAPVDLVLAASGVPAIGLGARYARQPSPPASGLGLLLWVRAWLLGLAPEAPFVQPLDQRMRPQLEGHAALELPSGFLSAAGLTIGVRLPVDGAPGGVTTRLDLTGRPMPGSSPTSHTCELEVPPPAGDERVYLKRAIRLTAFLAHQYLRTSTSPVARRLVDHLVPLLGQPGGVIAPFPIDELVDGKTGPLASWALQFVPTMPPWDQHPAGKALGHLWALVRPRQDGEAPALSPGSLTAWLAGDATAGFGIQLDGRRDATALAGEVGVGLVARTQLVESALRARLDLRLALAGLRARADEAPALAITGPALEATLALDPSVDGAPLVATPLAGTTAAIQRGRVTVRWRPGALGAPGAEVRWRFETSTPVATQPAEIAHHVVTSLSSSLSPQVRAFLAAALAPSSDLVAPLHALAPAMAMTLGEPESALALAVTPTAAGAPPGLALTAGTNLSASLDATGVILRAELPLPSPTSHLPVALLLSARGDALDLQLRVGVPSSAVTVPLAIPTADVGAYLVELLQRLALPTLVSALLDSDAPEEAVGNEVKLGDLLTWSGLATRSNGAWAPTSVTALADRGLLRLLADLVAGLATKGSISLGELGAILTPTIETGGASARYGLALAAPPAATAGTAPPAGTAGTASPAPGLTLLDTGDVNVQLGKLEAGTLELGAGGVSVSPSLTLTGLALRAGSREAPLLPAGSGALSIESATLATDITLGGAKGVALPKLAFDIEQLRLALGGNDGDLASSLLGPSPGDSPGWRLGVDLDAQGARFRLAGPAPVYLDLDAQFGPLSLRRLGLDLRPVGSSGDQHLHVLLDGGLALGPLAASVAGLGVHFAPRDLGDPSQWTFTLDGLGLALDAGPVSLSGFLQRHGTGDDEELRGAAVIKLAGFQLGAVGAYRQIDGDPSLFVFAALNAPLGGPPFFFVTGVAGGFGVNRQLVIPDDPKALDQHVLFRVMEGDATYLADVGAMGDALAKQMPAEVGSSWFAAGVSFTSFSLIQGKALLYVRFGRTFELGIAARATFEVPQIAEVTLVLKGAFVDGDDPRLTVRADLVDSWLLSKDCRLTGSFFFGLWPRRGDCLLTIGGFHKDYRPPAHYPGDLARLGFSWAISTAIKAEGSVYFALTPREAMAGASLTVAGTWGPLAAGFDAWFDAWIGWDPFWFDLSIGVRVWVKVFGVRASLGISLRIWGPPVGGTATIEVLFWSFTIPFGESRTISSDPLPVGRFASQHLELELLPEAEPSRHGLRLPGRSVVTDATSGPARGQRGLFTLEIGRGAWADTSREATPAAADGSAARPFRVAPEFVLNVRSRVPVRRVEYLQGSLQGHDAPTAFGFVPCALGDVTSRLGAAHVSGAVRGVPTLALLPAAPMPRALFDTRGPTPESSSDATIALPMGLRLDAAARRAGGTGPITIVPERSRPEETISLPEAWGAASPAPVVGPVGPVVGPVEPLVGPPPAPAVAPTPGPVVAPTPGIVAARISGADADADAAPVQTTAPADRALREVVIEAPRPRGPELEGVVLRDLGAARSTPTAIRARTRADDRLVADTRALLGPGLRLPAGDAVVLHDLAPGATLAGEGESPVELTWFGGFGAPLAHHRALAPRWREAAPAGAARALVRVADRPARGEWPAFDADDVAIRIGDRVWSAGEVAIGITAGEPLAGQPAIARVEALTRGLSGLRLWFVPVAPIEGGRFLSITLAVDPGATADLAASERARPLGEWTRHERELGAPLAGASGDHVTLRWHLDDELPCTVSVALPPGAQLLAAELMPARPSQLWRARRAAATAGSPAGAGEVRLRLSASEVHDG